MSRTRRALSGLFITIGISACTQGGASPSADAVVDTLPNGVIHVVNGSRGAWAASGEEAWRLEEELRVGQLEGTGPTVFGQIRNVIPNSDDSLWLLDGRASELRLFDAEGRFVRAVGRSGDGPGEFAFNPCAFQGPNGEIWVEDIRRRWQRFSRAGELLGQLASPSTLGCGVRQVTRDGRFLAVNSGPGSSPGRSTSYFVEYAFGDAGDLIPVDTIVAPVVPPNPTVSLRAPTGAMMIQSPPLTHRATWILAPSGHFYVIEGGGKYLIQRRALSGDTLLLIEREYEPIVVPDSTRARLVRDFAAAGALDPNSIARIFPPFDQVHESTDGSIWVRRQLQDGRLGMDVFSEDGIFLGPVRVPADFGRMFIHHIDAEHLYAVARGELDEQYVVRLRIRRS